ncbi:MAG: cobyric acid synthase [Bacteroidaceae bacterium]|nr:cobyric acid synthase [Bacteroidaceae bacterium]
MTKPTDVLHPLMLVGTGSDVGKSVLATALCRIFLQDGYRPAPFKAQNMALNSFATADGKEIGRAQAVQAEAARLQPTTDMNPLLLKPNSEHTTQVVLNGKPIGNRSAYDYFRREGRDELRAAVGEAFDRLASRFNPIVMEGAGSVAEINLRDSDIVNMSMAKRADADVVLVADIDRGGVFASAYGSVMLQTEEDRRRIKGIIVNKFRGDLRLFADGRKMLEEICGVPVLGVVPMFHDIVIEEEDSVELERKRRQMSCGKVNVAVVLLHHISNFTDFDVLERDERINLFYTNDVHDVETADIVILPGTKSTLDDLSELRRNGLAQAVVRAHRAGKTIVGICGGYQMLGTMAADPDGVEGSIRQLPGLGLLPVTTVMTTRKTTEQVCFTFDGSTCHGYEIHQGESFPDVCPDENTADASTDVKCDDAGSRTLPKVVTAPSCIGTYVHGFFDNPSAVEYLLRPFSGKISRGARQQISTEEFKDLQYDRLAEHVRKYVDIDRLYSIMKANR